MLPIVALMVPLIVARMVSNRIPCVQCVMSDFLKMMLPEVVEQLTRLGVHAQLSHPGAHAQLSQLADPLGCLTGHCRGSSAWSTRGPAA